MTKRLQSFVLAASVLQLSTAKPADPTITAAAVLPRQNPANFIGFIELNSTWTSVNCNPGLTWFQSGPYAQCCATTLASCYAPTACVQGSQIYTYPDISSKTTIACTDNYNNPALSICNTIFIFENDQDSNPKTNINCGDTEANWSYYRDLPASATKEVVTSPTDSVPDSPATAPSAPSPTSPAKSGGSKAWIAGAVAGPVLGLALIGAGVWLCMRRRKKKAAQMTQHGTASMAPIDPSQPPAGVGGYTDAKPQFQPAQPTYYNPPGQQDAYNQQGYPQQGGISPPQMSPAPQYSFQQSAYNATATPPPGPYQNDVKYPATGETAELGGSNEAIAPAPAPAPAPAASSTPSSPQPYAAHTSHVAELSGTDATPGHSPRPQ